MANVGDLAIKISANTTKFDRAITQVETKTHRFGISMSKVGNIMKGAFVGGTVLAAGAIYKMKGQMEALDQTAKTAARTGFSGESLSVFGFAAEQSGASVDAMNKSIDRFVRVSGDAQAGVGASVKAFETLGMSQEMLARMSPEQQFESTMRALAAIEDPAQRASASYAIFGRQGQELTNTFEALGNNMDAFRAEADKMGILFSDEQLKSIEAANDAMNRLSRSSSAIFGHMATLAAPVVEHIANAFGQMSGYISNVFGDLGSENTDWFQNMIDETSKWFGAAFTIWDTAFRRWDDIFEYMVKLSQFAAIRTWDQMKWLFADAIPALMDQFLDKADNMMTANWGEWDIPERATTNAEKKLARQLGDLGDSLGEEFSSNIGNVFDEVDRMAELRDPFKLEGPDLPDLDGEQKETRRQETKFVGVMGRGSEAAFRTIVTAMRGASPELKESKKQTELLKKIAQNQQTDGTTFEMQGVV